MSFFDDFRKARASLTGRESIATLNYMLEYFGDDGENWTPRVYSAANGARCLVGAADYARVSAVDDAKYWLRQAIAEREPHLRTIEQFNDSRESTARSSPSFAGQFNWRRPGNCRLARRSRLCLPRCAQRSCRPGRVPSAVPAPVMRDVTPLAPQPVRERRPSLFWELLNE